MRRRHPRGRDAPVLAQPPRPMDRQCRVDRAPPAVQPDVFVRDRRLLPRLMWGIEEYSASSLHLADLDRVTLDRIRRGAMIAAMIAGVGVIRWFWSRHRRAKAA